jgi:hypothetical protein
MLVMVIAWVDSSGYANASNSARFNGVPLTRAVVTPQSSSHSTEIWYLANPPVGTFTAEAQYAGTLDRFGSAFAANLAGVSKLGITGQTAGPSGTSRSTTVIMPNKGLIVMAGYISSGNNNIGTITPVAPAGCTAIGTATNVTSSSGKRASGFVSPEVPAGSTACTVNLTAASQSQILSVAGFVP